MDNAQFRQLLQGALEGDHVNEATTKLKKDFYPKPESLSLLLQLLVSDEPPQLRQLAATQARNHVRKHWPKTPDDHKPQIRSALLQSTLHEPNVTVRHASASVIASIARLDFADGQWTDLPRSMMQAASGSNVKEREVSTYIILTLLDEMTEEQTAQLGPLYQLFEKTIQDPESAHVRVNTVLSLGKLAHTIDCDDDSESLQKLQQAFPAMLAVLKDAIIQKNEEHTAQLFDCFQDFLDDDSRILGPYFKDLITIAMQSAKEAGLDSETRMLGLNYLMNAVLKRKGKFQSLKLSGPILQLLWDVMVHLDQADPRDDSSLAFTAVSLLNIMAVTFPPSQVVAHVVQLFMSTSEKENPRERQVATNMLSTCVEGAPDFMDQQLSSILPQVIKLMHDSELKVRKAAVEACNELAECLPDSVAKAHESVIDALGKNLAAAVKGLEGSDSQTNSDLAASCCQCIESLARGIPSKHLVQYLSSLVPHLRDLFSHSELKIKESAIGAVGTIAAQAKKAFIPYFAETVQKLQENLHASGSEDILNLRAITVDTMASFALSVGPEAFRPYVQSLMEASEGGLHLESPMLKESSYMFWGTLATVYKKDFESFLPGVTKTLLEKLQDFDPSLTLEGGDAAGDLDGKELVIGGKKVKIVQNGTGKDVEDDVEEIELDGDEDDWDDIDLAGIEEGQEMALDSLAQVFTAVGPAYLPYFPDTIATVTHLLEHPIDNVRKAAMANLGSAYEALWLLQSEEQQKWKPGLPLKTQPIQELTGLRDVIISAALTQYKEETDSDVIAGLTTTLASIMKECGPHIISGANVLNKLIATFMAIICKKHPCQHEDDEDEDEDDEDDEDEEDEDGEDEPEDAFAVIDAALDAVAGLAAALGPQFAQTPWEAYKQPIGGFATSSNPVHRAAAIGALAECIRGCGAGIAPHATALQQLLLARGADEDHMVRSNAAYGLGLLVEHAGDEPALANLYQSALRMAMPKLADKEGADERERDNWAGCVARLAAEKPSAIPMPQVLTALVEALPLEEDFQENEPVWGLLVSLYRDGGDEARGVLGPLTEKVMAAAETTLGEPEEQLKDSTREEVLQLVRFVQTKSPSLVNSRPGLAAALSG